MIFMLLLKNQKGIIHQKEYLNSALKKLSRNEEELEKRLNAIGS